jgi:hypothetical protein
MIVRQKAGTELAGHVQYLPSAAAHTAFAAFLGIKVVVPRGTGHDFPVFGHPKALSI